MTQAPQKCLGCCGAPETLCPVDKQSPTRKAWTKDVDVNDGSHLFKLLGLAVVVQVHGPSKGVPGSAKPRGQKVESCSRNVTVQAREVHREMRNRA